MNYRAASLNFVNAAFNLLVMYKNAPQECDPNKHVYLEGNYGLRISKNGHLNVINPYGNPIAHSYNETYSQITYVGKLLAVYLEHLQMDDC